MLAIYATASAASAQATERAQSNAVAVSVIAGSTGLSLFVRHGHHYDIHYERLCEAPCQLSLEPGRYTFGVSIDGYTVVDNADAVVLSGPTSLELGVRSARRRRVVSWTVFLLGMLSGSALTMAGLVRDDINVPLVTVGSALYVAGLIAIFPATSAKDRVWVHARGL